MQWVKRPAAVAAAVAAAVRKIRTIVVREPIVEQAPRRRMRRNARVHQTPTTQERDPAQTWALPAAQVVKTLLTSRKIKIKLEAAPVQELEQDQAMEQELVRDQLVAEQDLLVTELALVRVQQVRELVAKETQP